MANNMQERDNGPGKEESKDNTNTKAAKKSPFVYFRVDNITVTKSIEKEVEDVPAVEASEGIDAQPAKVRKVTEDETVTITSIQTTSADGKSLVLDTTRTEEEFAEFYLAYRNRLAGTIDFWQNEIKTVTDKISDLAKAATAEDATSDTKKDLAEQRAKLNKWVKEKTAQLDAARKMLSAADKHPEFGVKDFHTEEKKVPGKEEGQTETKTVKTSAAIELNWHAKMVAHKAAIAEAKDAEAGAKIKPPKKFDKDEAYQLILMYGFTYELLDFDHTAGAHIAASEKDAPALDSIERSESDDYQIKNKEDALNFAAALGNEAKTAMGHRSPVLQGVAAAAAGVVIAALLLSGALAASVSLGATVPAMLAFVNLASLVGPLAAAGAGTALASATVFGGAGLVAAGATYGVYAAGSKGVSAGGKQLAGMFKAAPAPKAKTEETPGPSAGVENEDLNTKPSASNK